MSNPFTRDEMLLCMQAIVPGLKPEQRAYAGNVYAKLHQFVHGRPYMEPRNIIPIPSKWPQEGGSPTKQKGSLWQPPKKAKSVPLSESTTPAKLPTFTTEQLAACDSADALAALFKL